jgi:uncharacterized protein involved in outer membrane biogenesis
MTALRHITLGLVALLVLLLGGAWLAPSFLDWNRYRGDVSALASAALGQAVRIEGPITLRVLPEPLLVAGRVTVDAGGGGAVTAEQLRLRVALMPLLAGRVDAREMVLRGADIRLPWPPDPASLVLRTPSWLSALSARIERGRLRIGDVAVTGLEATLAINEASGSFISAGRFAGGGRDWAFTARISQPGGDGAVGVDVTLDTLGSGAVVSGQLQPDGTMLGRVALRGTDLSQLVPAPAVPFRVEGRLTTGGGLVAADELAGELAGAPVKGAVALRLLPRLRLDVALAASRLDLDAWGPALLRRATGGLGDVPLGIDLSAEAAPWAGATLRGLRAAFDIADGAVEIREARAILPGDAALRLKGHLVPADRLRFQGEASLEAPALRTTLAWAARAGLGPVDAAPPAVLRSATLRSRVAVEDGELQLSDMEGQVDGTAVLALLSWRPTPRPTLRAVVTAEQLDLDSWVPTAWPGPAAAVLPATAGMFGALSLDLQLAVERAIWRGMQASALSLGLAAAPGRIELRQMEAQALGAALSVSGTLLEGGRIAEGKAELKAQRAAGFAPLIAQALGADVVARMEPLLRGGAQLQLRAGGAPETLGLRLAATLADLQLEATPTLDLPGRRWSGSLMLRHPGAPRLAETLGLSGAPAWLGDGSLALVAQLAGTPERILAESFNVAAGGLRAAGSLRLDHGLVPRLSGRIAAESLMLPLPYARSPDPLPLEALSGWEAELNVTARTLSLARDQVLEDAAATITLARGQLAVAGLAARLAGGSLAGSLSFDAAARPPALSVAATIRGAQVAASLFDTTIDIAGGVLDGTLRLSASGFAPAALLASLDGSLSLAGRDGTLTGIDLARMGARLEEADLRAALAGGATAFDRLAIEAAIGKGGLVLQRAALAGRAGTATATGTIDLTRTLLALRLAMLPAVPDPPEIGLRLAGPADAPQRVPELAGAVRWRAEHPQ